ncbi:hypothetical protein [Flavobacterium sp. H122]|uniref:hypothetical protein n=1 Tax=Flavobacterium sp. H122 TaxID=2529860 RepID=UPI0010AAA4FB|nr:hypothetical protein [Flavobacterium sp. H122]
MKKFILIAFSIISLMCFSCEEILLEDDISKEEVVLVAPQNNEQFNSTSITFTWEPVQYAKKYRLQIAKPNFTSPTQIVLDTEITVTNQIVQLPVGSYEWRVQAISGNTTTAYQTRSIVVLSNQNFQDNTVVLSSPANNFNTNITAQNLSWESVIGATGYTFQVFNSNNVIITTQNITGTSTSFTFPEGSFTWRVRATNGNQNTLFSSNNIIVDVTAPNVPTLVAPSNATVTNDTSVNFQWSRTPIAGSIESDKIYIFKDAALTNLFSETQTSSPYSVTLPVGTYYWYVKSFDIAGNQSVKSNVYSLTIN